MKSYSTILQEVTEQEAREWAQGFDFSQDELSTCPVKRYNYVDTVNGISIYYDYAADYYFFSDE